MGRLGIVTGASSGIGEAYAERLAADGWDLIVVARRRDRLEQLAKRLADDHGISVQVVEADLADADRLRALCRELSAESVELLVNNAALAHYMPFAELPDERAQELVELNVLAPVLLTRAVLPGMLARGLGAVVNVASLLAFSGSWEGPHLPVRAVYAASKSFLVTFTQRLASELDGTGVRVQVVCPGIVRTEFHSRQGIDLSAVSRMEPEDVVRAALVDLERGEIVSIPGADDETAHERIAAAERALLDSTRSVDLPPRYKEPR
jgi:short-subunit dehydrogenase